MHKLWRGTFLTHSNPILSTAASLNPNLPLLLLLHRMPSLRLSLPPLYTHRSPNPALRRALLAGARLAPPEAAWMRSGGRRNFAAVEASKNREKGRNLEGSDGEEVEEEEEKDKKGRTASGSERRHRGGAVGAPPVGSVELLAIPGVGHRNLKKLVDKGFQGIIEEDKLELEYSGMHKCDYKMSNSAGFFSGFVDKHLS